MERSYLLAALFVAFYHTPSNANEAVESSTYGFSLGAHRSDIVIGNVTSTFVGASGTLPIGSRLGVTLAVTTDRHSFADAPFTLCKDLTSSSASAALFARSPVSWKFGGGYSYSWGDGCRSTTGTVAFDSNRSVVLADAYLGPVTLGATGSRSTSAYGRDSYSSLLHARWYPDPNTVLSLSTSGFEEQKDKATLGLDLKPSVFPGNELSFTYGTDYLYQSRSVGAEIRYADVAFGLVYQKLVGNDGDSWTVNLRYHLDKRVDLLTRDRYYR